MKFHASVNGHSDKGVMLYCHEVNKKVWIPAQKASELASVSKKDYVLFETSAVYEKGEGICVTASDFKVLDTAPFIKRIAGDDRKAFAEEEAPEPAF